jgi:hypothetical protein
VDKADAKEAAPIVQRTLGNLIKTVPSSGRYGSNARSQISSTMVNAYALLRSDTISDQLIACFDLTLASGATWASIDMVRLALNGEPTPNTIGATLILGVCLGLCFSSEGTLIAGMTFDSREDVDNVLSTIQGPFSDAEETAADAMDQATYMALVQLHAAIVNFLVTTARPLPRMLNYQFAASYPSLVISYKLYDTADRADEVRNENKIVHPAFCPMNGLGLSA